MEIEHLITPYKLGKAVLQGSGVKGAYDEYAVDCPTVFRHNGRYYMLHVGFDGTGYQTGLAVSDDLVSWERLGVVLARGANRPWDSVGMAATAVLMDNSLRGGNELLKWNGKYWLMYHSYPDKGYEAGSAEVGLAYTDDESLLKWTFVGEPVFSWREGARWERGGLYKVNLVRANDRFYMYYNAKNDPTGGWEEQIGMAVSDDLMNWERCFDRPIVPVNPHAWDSRFASDPFVMYDEDKAQWVMFYYGLGDLSACDGLAVSRDMYTWTKFPAPILTTGRAGTLDSKYAHKPCVICKDGMLYHFYCAVRPMVEGDIPGMYNEFRCITVARSEPWQV